VGADVTAGGCVGATVGEACAWEVALGAAVDGVAPIVVGTGCGVGDPARESVPAGETTAAGVPAGAVAAGLLAAQAVRRVSRRAAARNCFFIGKSSQI